MVPRWQTRTAYWKAKGKGRRHLKLHTLEDVENKHLTDYLQLAQKAAE